MPAPNIVRPVSEWSDPRHRRGLSGELAVARWLEGQGWGIEAHRFRFGRHDIDLIARQGNQVAFIEVKTRGSTEFGTGAESIGYRKRALIQLVAEVWRARHGRAGELYRFDVVLVGWGRKLVVLHLPDAWRAG